VIGYHKILNELVKCTNVGDRLEIMLII